MPRYRVLQRSFINDRAYAEGDEVEYEGIPAENLHPLCKDAKAAVKAAADAGVLTAATEDWNPVLGISDAAKALAGTTAGQNKDAIAAVAKIMANANSPAGSAVAAL
jgi:hypothetical protein